MSKGETNNMTDSELLMMNTSEDEAYPRLQFNPKDHWDIVEDSDAPEEVKIEYLRTLFQIFEAVIDLKLGEDSVEQLVQHLFGDEMASPPIKPARDSGNEVQQKSTSKFNQSAMQLTGKGNQTHDG